MNKQAAKVKVVKTSARKIRYEGEREQILAPAEYEIRVNDERRAVMVKAQDGWRVCKPTPSSRIGMAISPVGLDAFRMVRDWAVDFFSKKTGGGATLISAFAL